MVNETPGGAPACLVAALEYAARGWLVIPIHRVQDGRCSCGKACKSPGKHPRTKHGLSDGSREPEVIKKWWQAWPEANVAIVTGEESGLVVIDLDPRHEGDYNFLELQGKIGDCPPTPTVASGGGGRHLYLRHPGQPCATKAGIQPGIDIRGDGGYIIAPPSIHPCGQTYSWDEAPLELPLAEFPPEYIRYFYRRAEKPLSESSLDQPPSTISAGSRNEKLTSFAGKLRHIGCDEAEIVCGLQTLNQNRCSPPLDSAEIQQIARSVARYPLGATSKSSPSGDRPVVRSLAELRLDPPVKPISLIGEGLLVPGGFLLLAGSPGCGKSWAALDLLVSGACGLPWLGHPSLPVQRVRTLLVSMELPAYLLRERAEAVAASRWLPPTAPLDDALVLSAPSYAWVGLDTEAGPLLLRELIEKDHIKLLILDPFSRLHSAEENDAREIGTVLRIIDDLRQATGCAVVLIHHVRKSIMGKGRGDLNSIRGSGRLISDPQTVMLLERRQDRLCLSTEKINCGPTPDEIWLIMQSTGSLELAAPPEDKSKASAANQAWTLAQLQAAGKSGLTIQELMNLPDHPAVKEPTLRKYCRSLEAAGLIQKVGSGTNTRWRNCQQDPSPP